MLRLQMRGRKFAMKCDAVLLTVENIKFYPFHYRSGLRIFYVLEGALSFTVACTSIHLSAGDVEFANINEPVEIAGVDDNKVIVMEIAGDFGRSHFPDIENTIFNVQVAGFFPGKPRFDTTPFQSALQKLKQAMLGLFAEYAKNGCLETIEKSTIELLNYATRHFDNAKNLLMDNSTTNTTVIERFSKIHHYMLTRMNEKITLDQIAKLVNLSPKYLSAEFKKRYKRSFGQVLEHRRVVHAVKRLLENPAKISTIPAESGFSDNRYFYRVFKRYMKCTPREFMKKTALQQEICTTYLSFDSVGLENAVHEKTKGTPSIEEIIAKHGLRSTGKGWLCASTPSNVRHELRLLSRERTYSYCPDSDETWCFHAGEPLSVTDGAGMEIARLGDPALPHCSYAIDIRKGVPVRLIATSPNTYTLFTAVITASTLNNKIPRRSAPIARRAYISRD